MRRERPVSGPAGVRPAVEATLATRVFRALYRDYELHHLDGIHVVARKGDPVWIGASLGRITREISAAPAHCPRGTGWPS
jgi:hypothetical protein